MQKIYGAFSPGVWAAAFQALSILTHVAFLPKSVHRLEYLTLLALWSYRVMVAMCVGAGMALQRQHGRLFHPESRNYELAEELRGGSSVHADTTAPMDADCRP